MSTDIAAATTMIAFENQLETHLKIVPEPFFKHVSHLLTVENLIEVGIEVMGCLR